MPTFKSENLFQLRCQTCLSGANKVVLLNCMIDITTPSKFFLTLLWTPYLSTTNWDKPILPIYQRDHKRQCFHLYVQKCYRNQSFLGLYRFCKCLEACTCTITKIYGKTSYFILFLPNVKTSWANSHNYNCRHHHS